MKYAVVLITQINYNEVNDEYVGGIGHDVFQIHSYHDTFDEAKSKVMLITDKYSVYAIIQIWL